MGTLRTVTSVTSMSFDPVLPCGESLIVSSKTPVTLALAHLTHEPYLKSLALEFVLRVIIL